MTHRWLLVFSIVIAWLNTAARATQQSPEFDVVSVRPNLSGDSSSSSQTSADGGYRATNVTARILVLEAYDLQSFELTGGPAWLDSDRFDVIARPPAGAREEQIGPMLQALLRNRFSLLTHKEQRDLPIYTLVRARADGRLGPQLEHSKRNCVDERANAPEVAPRPGIPACGLTTTTGNAGGLMKGGARTIAEIAAALGNTAVSRRVVDRTGIEGAFDFELQWMPDAHAGIASPSIDDVSIFTAVQEQLWLKLVSGRGPVDVLVIDRIERPSVN